MKKILILGGNGQLGREVKFIEDSFISISKSDCDIGNKKQLNVRYFIS